MKKTIIILIAVVAAVSLTASESASDNNRSKGVISFESSAMPALNCSMSIQNASNIYKLVPGNIREICEEEYIKVSDKCSRYARFTHEGVNVTVVQNDGTTATIVFSVPGYKVTAEDVSWQDLDIIFTRLNH